MSSGPKENQPILRFGESDIRRVEGEWTKEEVIRVAQLMIAEGKKGFNTIAQAGRILYENQMGLPSLSSESNFFNDHKIRVETVDAIPDTLFGTSAQAFMASFPIGSEPSSTITLELKKEKRSITLQSPDSIRLDKIQVQSEKVKNVSDFDLVFSFAKEICTVRALDIVAHIAPDRMSSRYLIPSDEPSRRALGFLYIASWKTDGIPILKIVDIIGHFLLLSDYKLAKDLGAISMRPDILDMGDIIFTEAKALVKDRNGKYSWQGDPMEINQAFFRAAKTVYTELERYLRTLRNQSVPQEHNQ